jgi:hypothetical protein
MTKSRTVEKFCGLLFVTLCMLPACVADGPPSGPKSDPTSSELAEPPSPSSDTADPQSSDVAAAACNADGACQATGEHCCSTNRLFAPLTCGLAGESGYICGTCIPSGSCQPTGDHCCSANHTFVGDVCGGTPDGKQYSGYVCL